MNYEYLNTCKMLKDNYLNWIEHCPEHSKVSYWKGRVFFLDGEIEKEINNGYRQEEKRV